MVTFEGGIGQALAFAYGRSDLIVKSQWESIVSRMKQKGDAAKWEDLADKVATGQRINLTGLTRHEIAAQRVLLRVAVDGLPPIQTRTLNARYCTGWEKKGAIGMLEPCIPKVSDTQETQRLALLAAYGLCSMREVSRLCQINKHIATENIKTMKSHISNFETVAYASLENTLSGCGLID